jgi:tRNA1(Val) A37 N6-methylase TrmN6
VHGPIDDALDKARARRPPGWSPPGPKPRGPGGRADLAPGPAEDLSFLTGDFRIFQLKSGHRWSLDDFMTALVAIEATGEVSRAADLGCGIGSVLMMVAWAKPGARVVGVEAQALSAALARRSIAYNGLDDRCEVRLGDLRSEATLADGPRFDLVTGTPPYIPLGHGIVSGRAQRGPACFETRGGIEDYAARAAALLAPGGRFVACAGAAPEDRADRAVLAAGLRLVRRVDVVPRAGKPVLFRVVVAERMRGDGDAAPAAETRRFVVRDERAAITDDMKRARAVMGLPPVG